MCAIYVKLPRRPVCTADRLELVDWQGVIPRSWCPACGGEVFLWGQERCPRCEKEVQNVHKT